MIKFLVMGFNYFKDGWNLFDVIILGISFATSYLKDYIDIGNATTLRVFRLGRVLKLINRA